MTKYQVETVSVEGVTITKKVHLPKSRKPSPSPKTEQGFAPGIAELVNATPGIAPPITDFNRFSVSAVMPEWHK
jgi:hypothetical protein